MAANDNTKTAAYENYPNNPLMSASKSFAGATTGTQQSTPVEVMGADELTVEAKLATATAAGDLAVSVYGLFSDGSVAPVALVPIRSTGPTLSGGVSYYTAQYDVSGHTRVSVVCVNNNAAPQTITMNCSQG